MLHQKIELECQVGQWSELYDLTFVNTHEMNPADLRRLLKICFELAESNIDKLNNQIKKLPQ